MPKNLSSLGTGAGMEGGCFKTMSKFHRLAGMYFYRKQGPGTILYGGVVFVESEKQLAAWQRVNPSGPSVAASKKQIAGVSECSDQNRGCIDKTQLFTVAATT